MNIAIVPSDLSFCQREEVYKQTRELNPNRLIGLVRNRESSEKDVLNLLKDHTAC